MLLVVVLVIYSIQASPVVVADALAVVVDDDDADVGDVVVAMT